MPELPEVETIRCELSPSVTGKTIENVELFSERIVKKPSRDEFLKRITGRKIIELSRRGKYLIFRLDGGDFLIMHLKMSGSLFVSRSRDDMPKYTKAAIELNDGDYIFFRDPRSFGRIWLTEDTKEIEEILGPEPFTPRFTPEEMAKRLSKKSAPIKAVLLDQAVFAGIGNMYADEILYASKINPTRPASSLSRREVKRLYENTLEILAHAIESKGASVQNYFRPGGEKGRAHFAFKVAHGLGGKTCSCGGPIVRIVVRGRGTYYCPKCQK